METPIFEKVVARQPILNRKQITIGYELLFRERPKDTTFVKGMNGTKATVNVINSLLSIGLVNITGYKKCFINFPRELLLEKYFQLLPKEILVIEILEDIFVDEKVIEVCQRAKKKGFVFALDDFFLRDEIKPLIEIADIIKIDLKTPPSKKVIRCLKEKKKVLLAEKVETLEEFNGYLQMGFDYFQGFFFSQPQVISVKDIPPYKINLLRLMKKLQKDTKMERIAEIISQDLSLSIKLLKYINSAFFALRFRVSSVHRAAAILGELELKKWLMLVLISEIGVDRPSELIVQSTLRAKFCEFIAQRLRGKTLGYEAFTVGMFSLINVILQRPMEEVLEEIGLADEIKKALIEKSGLLYEILEIVTSYERLDLNRLVRLLEKIKIPFIEIENLYIKALLWTNKLFNIPPV